MGINYSGASYVGVLPLANSSGSLTYFSKRDLEPTLDVCVVVNVVVF